jgi:hypothetical protein
MYLEVDQLGFSMIQIKEKVYSSGIKHFVNNSKNLYLWL